MSGSVILAENGGLRAAVADLCYFSCSAPASQSESTCIYKQCVTLYYIYLYITSMATRRARIPAYLVVARTRNIRCGSSY